MSEGTPTPDELCPGCLASVHITPEEIQQAFHRAASVKPQALALQGVYEQRMRVCSACEALQFSTTCRHCGCLVGVKAKFAVATCPHPAGNRWQGEPVISVQEESLCK